MLTISRKRATTWHLSFLYANFFLTFLKGVAIVPLYLQYVDPRLYGAWLAAGQVIGYLGLLEFGTNRVLIQKVAVCAASRENRKLSEIVSTAFCLNTVLAVLPITVGLSMAGFVPGMLQISGAESEDLGNAFIVGALASSLMIFSFTPAGILQGLQRQVLTNVFFTGGLALGVLTVVVLLLKGYGLLSIPLGSVVHAGVTAAGDLSYMFIVLRGELSLKWQGFNRAVFKDFFSASSYQLAGNVAGTVNTQSDNVFIATALAPELCNVFTFTGTAHKMSATLAGYLSHAAMPSLAHLAGAENASRLRSVIGQLITFTAVGGSVLLGGAFFLNESFVRLWVGSQFYGGATLNLLFLTGALLSLAFVAFNNILVALGEFRTSAAAIVSQALMQLPLMVALGLLWGLPGLAVAAVLGLAVAAIPIQANRIIKRLDFQIRKLASGVYSIGQIIIVPFVLGAVMKYFWSPNDFAQLCSFGVIFVLLCASVYFFFLKDVRGLILDNLPLKPMRKRT